MSVLQGSVYVAQLVSSSDLTASTVTCVATAPDLTSVTYSGGQVTVTGLTATVPVPALLVGTYLLSWSTTGSVVGASKDQFTVIAATVDLISLPDIKEELNIRATDTSKDAKLRRWLSAANGVIENITGPIRPYPQTDYFDGGTSAVVLMARWVSSITSVKENWAGTDYVLTEQPVGASTNAYGYTFDRDTNTLVRRLTGGVATTFFPGTRNIAVSYVGGLVTIPDDIQLAAAELVKHWYAKAQPVRSGPFGTAQGDDATMSLNYLVPNAVLEVLETWRRPPGIF